MTGVCPFDGPHNLHPEDPCPVCGDLGHLPEEYEESSHSNCVHDRGHRMTDTIEVVLAEKLKTVRKQLQQEQHKTECLRISRDEWKRKAEAFEAQAKGKITDEWRRRVAAGEEGEV